MLSMICRFLKPVIADAAVVAKCHLSALYTHEKGRLFAQLVDLLQFYEGFEIDDHFGTQLNDDDILLAHYSRLQAFQLLAFKQVPKVCPAGLCQACSQYPNSNTSIFLIEYLFYFSITIVARFCFVQYWFNPQAC